MRQTGVWLCGLLVVLALTSCHTMMQVELSPELLRAGIKAGEILEVGDKVRITTYDGVIHRFVIHDITAEQILGRKRGVYIDDIDAVERLEVNTWRTFLVVAFPTIVVFLALGFVIAQAAPVGLP